MFSLLSLSVSLFCNDPATTGIYTDCHTLSLHDALPFSRLLAPEAFGLVAMVAVVMILLEQFKDLGLSTATVQREEITHGQVSGLFWMNAGLGLAAAAEIGRATSELQSLMRLSYAVFCLKKKKKLHHNK